jgi:hypothetical protein
MLSFMLVCARYETHFAPMTFFTITSYCYFMSLFIFYNFHTLLKGLHTKVFCFFLHLAIFTHLKGSHIKEKPCNAWSSHIDENATHIGEIGIGVSKCWRGAQA